MRKNGFSSENVNVFTALENFSLHLILEISYKICWLCVLLRKVKILNFHDETKQSFLSFEYHSELTILSPEKLIEGEKKKVSQLVYCSFL